ncbi:interleukin-6-like [Xiphophorus hellerii]|uniref:interleukin-6-like n=1 Tax=Xiphophorus hellerii TaxID=8084 RepID=UPI0013B3EA27|nr:interleukin-6-like [Xiphophorus hellerii]
MNSHSYANLSYGGSPVGKSLASAGYKMRARLQDGASHSGSDSNEETHSELPSSASCTPNSVSHLQPELLRAASCMWASSLPLFIHSFIHGLTLRLSDLRLLAALMLAAALPLCVPGAPLEGAVTDLPPEESSSEGEKEVQAKPCPIDPFNITETLVQILKVTKGHKEEVRSLFLKLFEFIYGHLTAPSVTFQEARLQRLAQDLTTYSALLKHVDKEYPGKFIVTELKATLPRLITKVKRTVSPQLKVQSCPSQSILIRPLGISVPQMRNADRVVALTGSQELQLIKELESLDSYHRKMMAHSILSSIHDFLVEWKRELTKRQVRKTQISNLNETEAD